MVISFFSYVCLYKLGIMGVLLLFIKMYINDITPSKIIVFKEKAPILIGAFSLKSYLCLTKGKSNLRRR